MQCWDLALLISVDWMKADKHEFEEKVAGLKQSSIHRQREVLYFDKKKINCQKI